ncbi:ParB/Srx family N-terminal domain-containing protein [Terrarubrum flagellatum]|uniref:ParB/Srx family N-terminal domain-containing protein n=1 Tax=Terrirubrum flagellatum TaxID=2895980 RepID=UPI00314532A2
MAAQQKIGLSASRDIPFNKLMLSQANVRRVKAGISIEQLAESIAQRTLLQGLSVRPVLDGDGKETGMFEVPAGGRRYRALELLVKQKRMAKTQGRSLYVRLRGPDHGKGAAGKWTDAATGQHGDLLDLIGLSQRHASLRDTLNEARLFLRLPKAERIDDQNGEWSGDRETTAAARRLFSMSRPVRGTIAEVYLGERGVDLRSIGVDAKTLRFHPCCRYRDHRRARTQELPALIAAVTNDAGEITGVHRTWLDPSGKAKAQVASPRRPMGAILGHGVRLGWPNARASIDMIIAGEGLETMLSLRTAMPATPMIAATSANHLAALLLPASLTRLYVALDQDAAGRRAAQRLGDRARSRGIEVLTLQPALGDFNEDLRRFGVDALVRTLRAQLVPADATRLLSAGHAVSE